MRAKFLIAAAASAAAVAGSPTAFAADLPMPPVQQVVCASTCSSWYLRGDIGIGIQTFSEFDHSQLNGGFVWPASWTIVQQDIEDTAFFGFGIGYEFNNWLRFDFTAEYRTKAAFKVTGSYTNFCAGGGTCFDVNTGNFSSSVYMANVYFDLGTWWCLTPFIGFGIGGAYNTISGIQDNGINSNGTVGFGYSTGNNSAFDLAWNFQAGVTYNVTNNFKVDLSWRYLNLGSPVSAVVQCQNTPACPGASYIFKDMTSNDFRVSLRWLFVPNAGFAVMSQPVYAPQPPLSSRG